MSASSPAAPQGESGLKQTSICPIYREALIQ